MTCGLETVEEEAAAGWNADVSKMFKMSQDETREAKRKWLDMPRCRVGEYVCTVEKAAKVRTRSREPAEQIGDFVDVLMA